MKVLILLITTLISNACYSQVMFKFYKIVNANGVEQVKIKVANTPTDTSVFIVTRSVDNNIQYNSQSRRFNIFIGTKQIPPIELAGGLVRSQVAIPLTGSDADLLDTLNAYFVKKQCCELNNNIPNCTCPIQIMEMKFRINNLNYTYGDWTNNGCFMIWAQSVTCNPTDCKDFCLKNASDWASFLLFIKNAYNSVPGLYVNYTDNNSYADFNFYANTAIVGNFCDSTAKVCVDSCISSANEVCRDRIKIYIDSVPPAGGEVTFSIGGNCLNWLDFQFVIDPNSTIIRVRQQIDSLLRAVFTQNNYQFHISTPTANTILLESACFNITQPLAGSSDCGIIYPLSSDCSSRPSIIFTEYPQPDLYMHMETIGCEMQNRLGQTLSVSITKQPSCCK